MRLRFHPSNKRLERWLDGSDDSGSVDEGVDTHVATCERCANRLEELAQPVPELTAALAQTLRAPEDLVQRLGARMTDTIRNQEDLQLFFELMGIPVATIRNLMMENPDD